MTYRKREVVIAALERLSRFASRTRADARGSIGIIFALGVVPIALFAGAAIDYSRGANAKTGLSAAADAAVLAAIAANTRAITADEARTNALAVFNAQAAGVRFASNITPLLEVSDTALGRNAALSFTADVPMSFMPLIGVSNVQIDGRSSGSSAPPTYIDFYLLLDNTPSMGVGATTSDINTMVANTSDQCAFACHDLSAGNNDYYALAKRLGVQMRIDVVRSATQQLMDTATTSAIVPGQYRAAVYTFGSSCGQNGPTQISALTSNLAAVKTASAAIDLMTIPYQNFNNDQCTDFDGLLAAGAAAIPTPGDGTTATAPQKVLFFVSDGVADAYYPNTCTKPTTGGRCQEPITTAGCTTLKNRGVKIAVLYTTYLPLPTNGWYTTWIAPFSSSISTNMQTCASPGLYFEVSPSQGIAEAMTALFKKAVAQAKLTL